MSSRDHALHLLHQSRLPGWNKVNLKAASRSGLDPRDRGLGESIAISVTKNLVLLRHLVKHYSGRELKSIDPLVQMILAIGQAQLRFFSRVPPSAAVDEAVEQSKRLKLGRASGFINAVLRRAAREPKVDLPTEENLEQYAHIVLSHPPELFRRYVEVLGWEKALVQCARNNTEPPTIVRAEPGFANVAQNRAVPPSDAVIHPARADNALAANASADSAPADNAPADTAPANTARASGASILTITPHRQPGFFVVEGATEADFARWAAEGVAQVQDPTAAGVVKRMRLTEGLRVLDRCCGVGTKTIQIAQQTQTGSVVATDPAAYRIERLNQTIGRLHLSHIECHAVGMLEPLALPTPFERILVDAPCSNSGVIQRRPEARFRQDEKSLASIRDLQRRILGDTVPHLAPGGMLVYSTCSIWPEENGDQVQWLLSIAPDLEVISLDTTLPSLSSEAIQHHDGGFTAVLVRKS